MELWLVLSFSQSLPLPASGARLSSWACSIRVGVSFRRPPTMRALTSWKRTTTDLRPKSSDSKRKSGSFDNSNSLRFRPSSQARIVREVAVSFRAAFPHSRSEEPHKLFCHDWSRSLTFVLEEDECSLPPGAAHPGGPLG